MLQRKYNKVSVTNNLTFLPGARLDADSGLATAAAGAATLSKMAGTITTEALVTAAGGDYTLTLTNKTIAANDIVLTSVNNGTNTTVGITVCRVSPGAGSVVILIRNLNAAALNGTLKISFLVVKA